MEPSDALSGIDYTRILTGGFFFFLREGGGVPSDCV